MAPNSVADVLLDPLPPLPEEADVVLPVWANDAVRRPRAQAWPDNRRRFAVTVVADSDHRGGFGPVSEDVASIIRQQIAPLVVGQDVLAWRQTAGVRPLGRHQLGAHARLAISAIELAMWDVRSRAADSVVGDLLGGRLRFTIPAYATAAGVDVDHSLAGDVASWIAHAGFWGQKWTLPGYDRREPPIADARRLERLRSAIGEDARLCIDVGLRWDEAYARQMLPVLAEHRVTWVEELGASSRDDLGRFGLAHAAGEHAYDPAMQLRMLTSGDVQIWQPDPSWNGGLAQSIRTAELAEVLGIPCFPHGAGLSAGLHLASVMPSQAVPAVEYHLTLEPLRQAVHSEPLVPSNGAFTLSSQPGLASPLLLGDDALSGSPDAA